ncbi:hypothetical protein [Vibrio sp. ABG19]|uniref:hypothetical protein n=1 Tax=Vibrio sp. ABG19 TaxID=2817385 RepID=UPI00249E01EC|nr:hypothetical protein [Vibrio sp. ABG19]WGY45049.1 hypothetical protein J0X00_04930 [Vibrio sp. ABG19]
MKYLLVVISIFLSSCAIRPISYKEPTSGPVTEVTFENEGIGVGGVSIFKGAETCEGRRITQTIEHGESLDLKVAADSPLSFSFGYNIYGNNLSGYAFCRVYVTFEPKMGTKYIARIEAVPDGCTLGIYAYTNTGEVRRVPNVTYRKPAKFPLYEESSFCE